MKQGKSLTELAMEIERQRDAKRDFIADTREIHAEPRENDIRLVIPSNGLDMLITNHTHRQIGDRVGIPAKYYDRMRNEATGLLANNINYWFREKPERRMIRTMDGSARAFLSDRYRIMDNDQIAEAVLPILLENPDLKIMSTEITDNRMYIKAVNPRLEREVTVGDVVQSGIIISNSEIGAGAFNVQPLVYRLVCDNGAIINSMAKKSYHTGARAAEGDNAYELYRDETLAADDKAFFMKAQDLVRAALIDAQGFEKVVESWAQATEIKLANPIKAVEVVAKRQALNESEKVGVLSRLIEGGDLSMYGMLNAITRHAQDVDSYDRSTELERIGPSLIDLPASDWREIAEAA